MTDEIKSFDDLWNQAEKRSLQVNKNDSTEYIMKEIENICADIRGIIEPLNASANKILHKEEIQKSITNNLIGELLFMLTTITARENVNIFSALKEHIDNL